MCVYELSGFLEGGYLSGQHLLSDRNVRASFVPSFNRRLEFLPTDVQFKHLAGKCLIRKAEERPRNKIPPPFAPPPSSSSYWYYSILKQSGKKPDDRNQSKLIFITIVDSRSIYHNYWTFTEIMLLITRGNDWCINVKILRWIASIELSLYGNGIVDDHLFGREELLGVPNSIRMEGGVVEGSGSRK